MGNIIHSTSDTMIYYKDIFLQKIGLQLTDREIIIRQYENEWKKRQDKYYIELLDKSDDLDQEQFWSVIR